MVQKEVAVSGQMIAKDGIKIKKGQKVLSKKVNKFGGLPSPWVGCLGMRYHRKAVGW